MKKLEELLNLPPRDTEDTGPPPEIKPETLAEIDTAIDKIDAALPRVKDLDTSDDELDELANLAKQSFEDLTDLGFNVDSRFASEIFSVASAMLGHAITAKTAKLNKKLKMVDLQLRKARLDREKSDSDDENTTSKTAEARVLTRNDLMQLVTNGDQKSK